MRIVFAGGLDMRGVFFRIIFFLIMLQTAWGAAPKSSVFNLARMSLCAQLLLSTSCAGNGASMQEPDVSVPTDATPVFERVLYQSWNGRIPFPVENLLTSLRSVGTTRGVLIPIGRSALAGYADFQSPRMVMVTMAGSEPIFLGFAERSEEIEIISPDRSGRFSFQIVRDYRPGGAPHLVPADRAFCLPCHQGEGPIFPSAPWDETNEGPQVAAALLDAIGARSFHGISIQSTEENINAARFIDNAVRSSNQNLLVRSFLSGVCGSDNVCRSYLLAAALGMDGAVPLGGWTAEATQAQADFLTQLQTIVTSGAWPAGGYSRRVSILPNRNPLAEDSLGGIGFRAFRISRDMGRTTGDQDITFDDVDVAPAFYQGLVRFQPLGIDDYALAMPGTYRPLTTDGISRSMSGTDISLLALRSLGIQNSDRENLASSLRGNPAAILQLLRSSENLGSWVRQWPPQDGASIVAALNAAAIRP